MDAKKKTNTFTATERAPRLSTRNLTKSNLAGVILGCTHATFQECLSKQLFGLPSGHYFYVKNIDPGLPLFLFNYSDRKLHGIFEATSKGILAVNSTAWTTDGSEKTPYAAQVKIQVRMRCQPLVEHVFQPIIVDNYFKPKLFWFELDQAQTEKLISVFSCSPVVTSHRPQSGLGWFDSNDTNSIEERQLLSGSINNEASKKWSSLFKEETCSDATEDPSVSQVNHGHLDHFNGEFDTRGVPECWKDHVEDVEAPSNLEDVPRKGNSSELPKEDTSSELYHYRSSFPCLREIVPAHNHSEVPVETCSGATKEVEEQKKWISLFKDETCSGATNDPSVSEVNHGHLDLFNGEFDTRSVPDYWEDHIEDVEAPSNLEDVLEDVREYGEVASSKPNCQAFCSSEMTEPSTSYLHLEVPRKENSLELPKEDTLSKSDHYWSSFPCLPRDIVPTHNHSEVPEFQLSNLSYPELASASEMNSSSIHSIVAKLLFEVKELRLSQFKQTEKVNSLEQKLDESRIEIQQLKNKCGIVSRCLQEDDFEEEKIQLVNDQPHTACDASICLVGGFDGCSWLSSLDIYFSSQDKMKTCTTMSFSRSYTSAAKFNDELYILGGVDGNLWYDTVESYNPLKNQWTSHPPLNQKKGSFALLTLEDNMFVVGGGNGEECLSDVEMFLPNIGKWIPIRSLLHKRFAPAAAELHGILYVSGGYNGNTYLKSMERLDPREHVRQELESMATKRGSHSLVVLNEKLYAIGGFDGTRMVSTVEIFDPRAGSWMMADSMNNSRGCFGAVVIGDEIHVIGGLQDDKEVLDTVESYKDGEGWRMSNWDAIGKRCFFSAVLL